MNWLILPPSDNTDMHILATIFNANIFVHQLNYKEACVFVNLRYKHQLRY